MTEVSFKIEEQYVPNSNLYLKVEDISKPRGNHKATEPKNRPAMRLTDFQTRMLFFLKNKLEDPQYIKERILIDGYEEPDLEYIKKLIDKNPYNGDVRVIFLHAPTGAGKTFSFLFPTLFSSPRNFAGRIKTIITEPTNSIINDFYCDFNKIVLKQGIDLRISKKTGKDRVRNRLFDLNKTFKDSDIIITNPDIVSLYIAGHYLKKYTQRNGKVPENRLEQWPELFRNVELFIVDEYHSYDELSLGKIIALVLLSEATGSNTKFLFSSATGNDKIIKILEEFGVRFYVDNIDSVPENKEDGRKYRGITELIFTDEKLIEQNPQSGEKRKIMYLFDHKLDAEIFIYKLKGKNIYPQEITGFNTRLRVDQDNECGSTVNEGNIMVCTNAAELGVNINPDIAHIEPGPYLENFWQRMGRTGRGKEGKIYVHVDEEQLRQLLPIKSRSGGLGLLNEIVESIQMKKRLFYGQKCKYHAAVFLYAVYLFSEKIIQKQVLSLIKRIKEFSHVWRMVKDFHSVLNDTEIDDYEKEIIKEWFDTIIKGYGYFRGLISDVNIKLPDNKDTTEDFIYAFKHYDMTVTYDEHGNKLFIINNFLDYPRKIHVKYKLARDVFVSIQESYLYDGGKFSESLRKTLLNDIFDDYPDRDIIVEKLQFLYSPRVVNKNILPPNEVMIDDEYNIFT